MFCESPLDARKDSAAALDELSRGDPDLGQILTFFDTPGMDTRGEPSRVTTPPAVANAIFDATGVRLRQMPFTPERVPAALIQK